MWFDNALHKEKIEYMFGGDLKVDNAELFGFSFYTSSSVRLSFKLRGIPDKHPVKWDGNGYNAIALALRLDGVILFETVGSKVGCSCNPQIEYISDIVYFRIKESEMDIYCKCKFLTIEGITPYIDERWD